MKRYERMSKEDIISLFGCPCEDCPLYKSRCGSKPCETLKKEWLKEEIKTKKVCRFTLLKTAEDVDKALKELSNHCDEQEGCSSCNLGNGDIDICLANYLKEEIEVEDEKSNLP